MAFPGHFHLLFEADQLMRGSYMSAHELLNLLNELGKSDKNEVSEHFISFSQRV